MRHHSNDIATLGTLQTRRAAQGRLGNLRSPGILGQHPVIGLVLFVIGIGVFSLLAINLQTNGPLIQVDVWLANATHTMALQSSPFIRDVMIFGFYLGEQIIVVIGVLLALYFLYKRFWPELVMVVVAWSGEGAIWLVLSNYFDRARPAFTVAVWHQMRAPGFPSGHSIAAVMCFGWLAYLIAFKMASRFSRIGVMLIAVLLVVYIGFSRIFVGDHYLTDVLAGYALGLAWLGVAFTTVELITQIKKGSS